MTGFFSDCKTGGMLCAFGSLWLLSYANGRNTILF